ncbi:bL21 family ribosomal protein [Candidatus Vidania fulgoroideorum]
MRIIFEYKKNQYFFNNKILSINNEKSHKIGDILKVNKILLLHNEENILIGFPYIKTTFFFKIIKITKKKKKSLKFKKRKRYRKYFGYYLKKTFIKII